jgi:hypothetical protein
MRGRGGIRRGQMTSSVTAWFRPRPRGGHVRETVRRSSCTDAPWMSLKRATGRVLSGTLAVNARSRSGGDRRFRRDIRGEPPASPGRRGALVGETRALDARRPLCCGRRRCQKSVPLRESEADPVDLQPRREQDPWTLGAPHSITLCIAPEIEDGHVRRVRPADALGVAGWSISMGTRRRARAHSLPISSAPS